jgi:hypothetical protein
MKSLRWILVVAVMSLSLSTLAVAQMDEPKSDAQPSDAQKSFNKLKTLAGSWEGTVTTQPPSPEIDNKLIHASLRVTSMGNAIMHEMTGAGRPDDPITMLYLDGQRLLLTHYCDAGNRPRMVARTSPDGQTVTFDFLDVVGSTQYGNMHDAAFTSIDANHHSEAWTWMAPDGKPVHVRFDLQRKK